MSEHQTPIGPIFELQRETLKRGADLLELPRSIRAELTEEGLATGEQVGVQLLELSRESIHRSLTVAESVQGASEPIDELRETVDTVFDELRIRQEDVYDSVEETHEQTETETLTRGAEQLTVLLDLSHSLETQLVRVLEELETQATRSDDVAEELTEQIEQLSEQVERYSDLQSDLREVADSAAGPSNTADSQPANEGAVRCRVCGNTYGAITHSHLQTHDMTVGQYRAEFGEDVPM